MKKKKQLSTRAVVLSEMRLSKHQNEIVTCITPEIYIKERQIRGGKRARYVS